MDSTLTRLILFFSFIFLITLSFIYEVVVSIPTHLIYFSFIFLLILSSIQEVVCSIPTTSFIFPFIFLKKFLCNLHLVRFGVQSSMTSHLKKIKNIAPSPILNPRHFQEANILVIFQFIFLSLFLLILGGFRVTFIHQHYTYMNMSLLTYSYT